MTLLNRIAEIYHESFLTNPKPQEYLSGLRITKPEIYNAFQIGYADGTLMNRLPDSGGNVEQLKEMGILTRDGKEYFADCVTFPLFDGNHNVVSICGRKNTSGKTKNYYLPGKKGIFNRQAAASSDEIIIVSSIIDCLLLYQNGLPNAIPLCGDDVSEEHFELFQTYRPQKIYLCLNEAETMRAEGILKARGFRVGTIQLPEKKNIYNYFKSGKTFDDFIQLITEPETSPAVNIGSDYSITEAETGLIASCQDRQYRIKGIPIYNLERLKVNIKATYADKCYIDTIDLYQNKARRYFTAQLTKVFGLEPEKVEADLLYLIDQIELYQAKQAETGDTVKTPQLTRQEEQAAIDILKKPDLLNRILEDMESLGYVGEETNKKLAYLISVSRKLPKPLSGEVISNSASGKSSLVNTVQELTPPEDVVFYSRITPQALYYMERDALKRKLLVIEERTGGESADYSIRILQSRQKLTQAVPIRDPNSGRTITKTFEVEGPIAYLETTTNAQINYENATRCFEIYLDESAEQTRRIHQAQREAKTEDGLTKRANTEGIKTRHHNLQRMLKPIMVEIPFATMLDFPADNLRTRRDHERFLSLIEAITFLFQYQREQKEIMAANGEKVICVVSTMDDYAMAYELAKDILGLTLDDLTKHSRDLLDLIRQLVEQKIANCGEDTFTRREIREFTGWQDHQIKAYIKYLEDMEYLVIRKVKERGQFEYQLNNPEVQRPLKGLLTPAELERLISFPQAG